MSLVESAASADGAFTSVPIIDLAKCSTPEGRLAAALEIRDACIRVGFFYIRNHGIPQSSTDKVFDAAQTFFGLPMEAKMKLDYRLAANLKGYTAPLHSNLDPANSDKGDFQESFLVGWEEIAGKAYDEKWAKQDGAMAGANQWPSEEYPGFRDTALEYYHAGMKIGKALFPLFALALELPETYFDDKTINSASNMRLLHYPFRDGYPQVDDNTIGLGAHTDFDCFTILWQQPGVQALQIRNAEGKWVNAPPIKDTLLVNIADQLARWSNNIFKSTLHRVVNLGGRERYSIAQFFGVDYHVVIEPIPSCVSPERPAKFDPVVAGEYIKKRLVNAYPKA